MESQLAKMLGPDFGKTVIIMRGVPGAGKSYHTDQLKQLLGEDMVVVVSADHYWLRDGQYRFEPERLTDAHVYCFRNAMTAMGPGRPKIVVVDNTNVSRAEYMPYVMLARANNIDVFMVRIEAHPNICANKNIHNVPAKTIHGMAQRFESRAVHDPFEYVIDGHV